MGTNESKPADAGEDLSKMETPELVRLAWETCNQFPLPMVGIGSVLFHADGCRLTAVKNVFEWVGIWLPLRNIDAPHGSSMATNAEGALTRWLDEKAARYNISWSIAASPWMPPKCFGVSGWKKQGNITDWDKNALFTVLEDSRLRALAIACIKVQRWVETQK